MGLRGRRSAADQEIPEYDDHAYLEPPEDLPKSQVKTWNDVIKSKPPDWFKPDSIPMLEAYCQAVDSYREIRKLLKTPPKAVMDLQRLHATLNAQVALMIQLQTKMRLTQSSRYSPKLAHRLDRDATAEQPWND